MQKTKLKRWVKTIIVFLFLLGVFSFNPANKVIPTETLQLSPTPSVTLLSLPVTPTFDPTEKCRIGTDLDCLKEPSLVFGSNGEWAYDVYKEIYYEYPSSWKVIEYLVSPDQFLFYFVTPQNSFEDLTSIHFRFGLFDFSYPYDEFYNLPFGFSSVYPQPHSIWHQNVINSGFGGSEFMSGPESPLNETFYPYRVVSVLSNVEQEKNVVLEMSIDNDLTGNLASTRELAKENFPNFYHILESIKIWNE